MITKDPIEGPRVQNNKKFQTVSPIHQGKRVFSRPGQLVRTMLSHYFHLNISLFHAKSRLINAITLSSGTATYMDA